MSAHTHGPWTVDETLPDTAIVRSEAGRLVADCSDEDGFADTEAKANARLTAAAPDMLAALKGFNLRKEWVVSGTASTLTLRIPTDVLRTAAEAVAKAEGRS